MSARPRILGPAPLVVALAASLLAAGSAVAGTPAMGVNGTLGLPCFGLEVSGPVQVSVSQKRAGTVIGSRSFVPQTDGNQVCLKALKPGDKLTISQGVVTRTATVPTLDATMNLAANTVTGTTSLIGKTVFIGVTEMLGGVQTGENPSQVVGPVPVGGAFSWTTAPPLDLQRGDQALADILTSTDEWFRFMSTSAILVQAGRTSASGTVPVGAKATAVLRTAKGVVRGRFTVSSGRDRNTAGDFSGTFRKGGKAVKVRPGDRISFSGSTTGFTVPKPNLEVDPTGNGSLTAQCPAGGQWIALVGTLRVATDTTAPSGKIVVSDLNGVSSGEHVRLICSAKAGWTTAQEVVVP